MITPIKINPISNLKFRGISANQKTHPKEIRQNYSTTDSGVILSSQIGIIDPSDLHFEMFLNKKHRVTLDEYLSIKKNYPEMLQRAQLYTAKTVKENSMTLTPKLCAELITTYRNIPTLTRKIISIGTSPSFLTEAMSALGDDIVFVPVSSVNYCKGQDSINDYFEYYPNLKLVGEYLKTKGVSPENLNNKMVKLLDYKATGKTLQVLKRIVCEYCKVPEENVKTKSLQHEIEAIYLFIGNRWEQRKKEKNDIIAGDIYQQKVENISNVPHFCVYKDSLNKDKPDYISSKGKSKETLFREFDEFSRPQSRAFQLCILNELDAMGKLS